MNDILIFGGTTEGRLLAQFCADNCIGCVVSVTTDYGAELLPESEYVRTVIGRKDSDEIAALINETGCSVVYDATHPYAVEVGKNIISACEKTGMEYIRIKRDSFPVCSEALYFDNAESAAVFSESTEGDIFIATGSKELPLFCRGDLPHRCVVRILPDEKIEAFCNKAGFKKVICGKGPFSEDENIEHFGSCSYIITKESGTAGGFVEKRSAAAKTGAELIIIRRPEEKGITLLQAEEMLKMKGSD